MFKKNQLRADAEVLERYRIFKKKENELREFINREFSVWGDYESIPEYTRTLIDREFIALGKFGKKIGIFTLEKKLDPRPKDENGNREKIFREYSFQS